MKKSLFFFIIFVASSFHLNAREGVERNEFDLDSFRGKWSNIKEDGADLSIDVYKKKILGTMMSGYTNKLGIPTGKEVLHYLYFDKRISTNEFSGKLKVFDEYYGCVLDGGMSTILFLNQNEIQIAYSIVVFDPPKPDDNYKKEEQICYPRYCFSDYYFYYYLCGYDCKKRCKKENNRCKVEQRIPISDRFVRKMP